MDTTTVEEVAAPNALVNAPEVADTASATSERPVIRYATDAEVDEAMKKIFEWHGPLLKKLAE